MDYEIEYLKLIKKLKHCADGSHFRETYPHKEAEAKDDGLFDLSDKIIRQARKENPEFFTKITSFP